MWPFGSGRRVSHEGATKTGSSVTKGRGRRRSASRFRHDRPRVPLSFAANESRDQTSLCCTASSFSSASSPPSPSRSPPPSLPLRWFNRWARAMSVASRGRESSRDGSDFSDPPPPLSRAQLDCLGRGGGHRSRRWPKGMNFVHQNWALVGLSRGSVLGVLEESRNVGGLTEGERGMRRLPASPPFHLLL